MKLLVAALDSELVAFPTEIPGWDRLVTGPGKVRAAYELTRALDRGGYDEIVVVGTAGGIDAGARGDVWEISEALQHDVTDLEGTVGRHVSLPERVWTGSGDATIATGDSFVNDPATVARIAALGATLLDMEAYVYIWVASQFEVPIRILKSISDDGETDALTDWRETVAACSARLWQRFDELFVPAPDVTRPRTD